jgi:hypothetical protein
MKIIDWQILSEIQPFLIGTYSFLICTGLSSTNTCLSRICEGLFSLIGLPFSGRTELFFVKTNSFSLMPVPFSLMAVPF